MLKIPNLKLATRLTLIEANLAAKFETFWMLFILYTWSYVTLTLEKLALKRIVKFTLGKKVYYSGDKERPIVLLFQLWLPYETLNESVAFVVRKSIYGEKWIILGFCAVGW